MRPSRSPARRLLGATLAALVLGACRDLATAPAPAPAESTREQFFQYVRLEEKKESDVDGPVWVPSPETDRHSAAAASR